MSLHPALHGVDATTVVDWRTGGLHEFMDEVLSMSVDAGQVSIGRSVSVGVAWCQPAACNVQQVCHRLRRTS